MIYVSTGGEKNNPAWITSKEFLEDGIYNIELSGGKFHENQLHELKKLKNVATFRIHNYFPPPRNPFVFNLASLDQNIGRKSYNHAINSINWAVELEQPIYSFHAGFLINLEVHELGSKVSKRDFNDRHLATNIFLERIDKISEYARKMGVNLLIENNVLSLNNHREFKSNPFLMATAAECIHIMKNTPSNVNLLIDLAHLKVSANSLNFDPSKFLSKCEKWIKAYHLSDNDGKSDSNQSVSVDSWFWQDLIRKLDYYCLEIYDVSLSCLKTQINLTRSKLKL